MRGPNRNAGGFSSWGSSDRFGSGPAGVKVVKVVNPYAPGLLQWHAWVYGWKDRQRGNRRRSLTGVSARVCFAYERGYLRTRWHRAPCGRLVWDWPC